MNNILYLDRKKSSGKISFCDVLFFLIPPPCYRAHHQALRDSIRPTPGRYLVGCDCPSRVWHTSQQAHQYLSQVSQYIIFRKLDILSHLKFSSLIVVVLYRSLLANYSSNILTFFFCIINIKYERIMRQDKSSTFIGNVNV